VSINERQSELQTMKKHIRYAVITISLLLIGSFVSCDKSSSGGEEGECDNGATRCHENQVEVCAEGAWVIEENCGQNSQVCKESEFGAQCVTINENCTNGICLRTLSAATPLFGKRETT
jgi:hypothetical protein